MTLALRLGLARHGVFEPLRDLHIANLDRLHGYAPRVRLLVEDLLQLSPQRLAIGHHVGQHVSADRLSQRRLRAHPNRVTEVLDLQNRFLRVPHHPEHDRVDKDRHGIAGQGRFRLHFRHPDPLVNEITHCVDDRNDGEQPRSAQPAIHPEPEHGCLFPLGRNLDGKQEIHAPEAENDHRPRSFQPGGQAHAHRQTNEKAREPDRADKLDSGHFPPKVQSATN